MDKFGNRIHIPSSGAIVSQLHLDYTGQYRQANADASFSDSLPIITDDCPAALQYFPLSLATLNILSKTGHSEEALEEKNYGVVICHSFDYVHADTGERYCLGADQSPFAFLAALWNATEDPLHMDFLLYSCTLLMRPSPDHLQEIFPFSPCFLNQKQVIEWLDRRLPPLNRLSLIKPGAIETNR